VSDPISRALEHFPTIQITLVSIIVALTLEQLLDLLPTIDAMWEPTLIAATVWCQAVIAFAIIVKMSAGFILSGVQHQRVPGAVDFLAPLGLLVFVDAQIAAIGTDHVVRWWYVLGAGSWFAAGYLSMHLGYDAHDDEASRLARARFRHAVIVEVTLGTVAIAVAVMHQAVALGPVELFVAALLFLLLEIASTAGPMVAWHALRRMSDERVNDARKTQSARGAGSAS
jgi:hypothetical protein